MEKTPEQIFPKSEKKEEREGLRKEVLSEEKIQEKYAEYLRWGSMEKLYELEDWQKVTGIKVSEKIV